MSSIQTEVDASYLYSVVASHEENESIADVLRQMSEIERSHALAFMKSNNMTPDQMPAPSWRAKTLVRLSQFFGTEFLLSMLLTTEQKLAKNVTSTKNHLNIPASLSDTAHVKIVQNLLDHSKKLAGSDVARFEKQHRSVGGNALRAAVLGGNDGLVSNFSLIMGVAGAASGGKEVLLAGMAGLLAGALSMALGEWISVKSSQELYENQMQLEKDELETNPEGEEQELALIYQSKGIEPTLAKKMAKDVMADKEHAHEVLVKEELGISHEDLQGSAMEAAVTSFILFAIGAIIPLVPFFFWTGYKAIIVSSVLSAFGLFGIGAAITLFTGKPVWYSGMRQVIFGLAAAAITYGIGALIGVQVAG